MKKNFLLMLFAWLLTSSGVNAHIDVVYPTEKNLTVSTSTVFFLGNTTTGADFSVNSVPVKLWEDNFFVHVIPLNYGKNTIKMISKKGGIKEEKIYTVNRIKQSIGTKASNNNYEPKKEGYILYTKTVNNNATVREKPTSHSNRVTELPKDVVLFLSGRKGDYYKIEETGDTEYWIHKSNVGKLINVPAKMSVSMGYIDEYSDKDYNYVKFKLNYPVFYKLKQKENIIELTIFGLKQGSEDNYKYIYEQNIPILGYDTYYEDNNLILRIRKPPKIKDKEHPLKNITILIDPGHGGNEKGSVGPTRIAEKDINLAISKYLVSYLKKEGANVIISRADDRQKGLYERVDIAKENNALISISIHNNALPLGKDPYVQHGTEVHYYNDNAKLLASIILDEITQDLYFKDNGIHKSSFALTRSTNPVSVLVECAYMINPEEYIRLRNPAVQKQIAKSIRNSLKKYINVIQK